MSTAPSAVAGIRARFWRGSVPWAACSPWTAIRMPSPPLASWRTPMPASPSTKARYAELPRIIAEQGLTGRISGLLLDLGVSSPQLDRAERGFSFSHDGPLDMRMDPESGTSAADWLANAGEREIVRVLKDYGEERFAKRIARAICETRATAAIETTAQLAALCERAVPFREPGKHPATRTFQALRIQVNSELDELRALLDQVCDLLVVGGRLVVISFHSLEDRIVKRFIRDESRGASLPKGLPVPDHELQRRLRPIGGAVRAAEAEVQANPRSRSAVLRAERSVWHEREYRQTANSGRFPNKSALLVVGLLMLSVIATAVAVIEVKYLTRTEFGVLQQVRAERDGIDVEWGRLQIEEAALTSHTRIEDNARRKLDMYLPEGGEVRVVEVSVLKGQDNVQ
jgi:16S rRNA (cytosine1402-N4)-methyltransferase